MTIEIHKPELDALIMGRMKIGGRPTILLGFLTVLSHAAVGQAEPDITEILKRVGEAYRAAKDYQLIGDATLREPGDNTATRIHLLEAFKPPNRYRVEGVIPVVDPQFGEIVIVHDGTVVWLYLREPNEYTSFTGSRLAGDVLASIGDLRPEAVDHFMLSQFRSAAELSRRAKFLREEEIEFAGAKAACYVLSITGGTWWVEKTSYRVLRSEDQGGSGIAFTTIELNEALPDDLFKFTPPADAKKVER
jgi:outer membrane lipoprotein-sorting protein